MELQVIDFLAQMINQRRTLAEGYSCATLWLCTREDIKESCIQEAQMTFEEWKASEMDALHRRNAVTFNIKYV